MSYERESPLKCIQLGCKIYHVFHGLFQKIGSHQSQVQACLHLQVKRRLYPIYFISQVLEHYNLQETENDRLHFFLLKLWFNRGSDLQQ